MQISELRSQVRARLLGFAWDEWAQMGVLATSSRHDRWAIDPEALLLFTLDVGRADARLFEEISDWMNVNEALISVRRLRNLCRDAADLALADAFLASAAHWRPRARLAGKKSPQAPNRSEAQPFFRDTITTIHDPVDAAFLRHGWLKAEVKPSGKSQAPDLLAPPNFSFRLRQILGVGARAEVVRVLLTIESPRPISQVTTQVIANAAGYARRNVQEALHSLSSAGVIRSTRFGNELRYGVERERWATMMGLTADQLPFHRDWPQLLHALRRLARWLEDASLDELSPYMLASRARDLADEIEPDLRYAGVHFQDVRGPGADYWQSFCELASAALESLG